MNTIRRRLSRAAALLLALLLLAVCAVPAGAEAPELTAEAVYVLDLDRGDVVYEKNAAARMYPASTTKLMTALLVLEHVTDDAAWGETVTCSTSAVTHRNLSGEGSTAGLLPGEKLTLDELLNFLLIQSANDASNVLAEYVAGTVEKFVAKMNARAAELGMTETHYANPHGEHNEAHYTCARDLALLVGEISKYDRWISIASTLQYTKEPTNKYRYKRIFNNTNKMISENSAVYCPYVVCGKTGFTTPAGYCLASYGAHDGMRVACVTMKSAKAETGGGYHFSDQRKLYKWIFEQLYKKRELLAAGSPVYQLPVRLSEQTDSLAVIAEEGISAMVNVEEWDETKVRIVPLNDVDKLELTAPVARGQKVGAVEVWYGDHMYGAVSLSCLAGAERSGWLYALDRIGAFFRLTVVRVVLILAAICLVALLILREVRVRRRIRQNRLRRYR